MLCRPLPQAPLQWLLDAGVVFAVIFLVDVAAHLWAMGAAAFFNNTTQPPNDGNQKDSPPVAVLPSGEYEDEWNRLRLRRGSLLAQRKQRPTADVRTWWKTTAEPSADVVSVSELIFSDSLVRPLDRDAEAADWPEGIRPARSHPGGARGVRFADEAKGLQRPLKGLTTDRAISISFWLRTPEKLVSTTILEHRHTADDKKTSGWKITSNPRGSLSFELADGKGGAITEHAAEGVACQPKETKTLQDFRF